MERAEKRLDNRKEMVETGKRGREQGITINS